MDLMDDEPGKRRFNINGTITPDTLRDARQNAGRGAGKNDPDVSETQLEKELLHKYKALPDRPSVVESAVGVCLADLMKFVEIYQPGFALSITSATRAIYGNQFRTASEQDAEAMKKKLIAAKSSAQRILREQKHWDLDWDRMTRSFRVLTTKDQQINCSLRKDFKSCERAQRKFTATAGYIEAAKASRTPNPDLADFYDASSQAVQKGAKLLERVVQPPLLTFDALATPPKR